MEINEILLYVNKVKSTLACPIDEGFIEPNVTDDDRVYVYCLSCSWKAYLGTDAERILSDLAHTLTS